MQYFIFMDCLYVADNRNVVSGKLTGSRQLRVMFYFWKIKLQNDLHDIL